MPGIDRSPSPDLAPDALGLLTRDHRLIEELFAEFERAAAQQLDPLARRICKMLRVHTQIEEELLYPIARRTLAGELVATLVGTAEREHAEARESIVRIESMTAEHAEFKATVGMLAEQMARHIEKEEEQLFPPLRGAGLDLVAIGVTLAERRDTLLDVLGLHDDDEEGAANQRETHQSSLAHRPRP
jgi:iron-sulfur cluster repair protein YtfE (RIC family)